MKDRALARRYGVALYQVAKDCHKEQVIFDELSLVIHSIQENNDFKKLILGSLITAEKKKQLVEEIYGGRISQELVNFLSVCMDKVRERDLEENKTV